MKSPKRYEDSPADKRMDKINAKKKGMSLKTYEKSDFDKKADAAGQKKLDTKRKK